MKQYLQAAEATQYIAANKNSFIDNPDEPPITEPFDAIENPWPVKLQLSKHRILHHLGSRPLRILEVASGIHPLSLYLANEGHDVTVMDIDGESLAWQQQAADKMGLTGMSFEQTDVLTLDTSERYDVVIARMLLHFFNEEEARRATENISTVTKVGGMVSVSVYTADNPKNELTPPRNLHRLFASATEVVDLFDSEHWQEVDSIEGVDSRPLNRSAFGKGLVLLPNVAEVVMRKESNPIPEWAVFAPDFSDPDDVVRYTGD